jgi:hypothetical protein
VLENAAKFRLDRRLHQRRGYVMTESVEKALNALPDTAEKAEVVESPQHKGADAPASGPADE